MVVSLSRYKYGKQSCCGGCCCTSANDPEVKRVRKTLDHSSIVREVEYVRERLDVIEGLLEDIADKSAAVLSSLDEISELSVSVREEIGEIENSVTVLKDSI